MNNYVVIQRSPHEKFVVLDGLLLDAVDGLPVDHASIYSKKHLLSTVSNDHGFFRLRAKEKLLPIMITASKLGYRDTTFALDPAAQPKQIALDRHVFELEEAVITYSKKRSRLNMRFLIPRNQRVHSLNIAGFFTALPFQVSLTPGASTQGKLSAQVMNKVSINMLGGYTGGVNGIEIGGLFNITKQNVQHFQAAGLTNTVMGSVKGIQVAGIYNAAAEPVRGIQMAGLGNRTSSSLTGTQVAGLWKSTSENLSGLQASAIANAVSDTLSGVQLSSILNTAGHVDGVQIGLINFAQSSSGISIGLLNFIRRGKLEVQAAAS